VLTSEPLPEELHTLVGLLPRVAGGQGQGDVEGDLLAPGDLTILLLSLQDRPVRPLAQEGLVQALTLLFYARGAAELVAKLARLGDLILVVIVHIP
jgi:hypothetical protein